MAAMHDALHPALWEELRIETLRKVRPIFREAFLAGTHAGLLLLPRTGRRDAQPKIVAAAAVSAIPPGLFDTEWINQFADQFIIGYSDEWWAALSEARQIALRQAILDASRAGLGPQYVMDQIAGLFDPVAVQRIAVTELTRLMGEGARQTYNAAGFPSWKWNTVNDALVCPKICEPLAGQIFPVSQPFTVGHVNCRCFPSPAGAIPMEWAA